MKKRSPFYFKLVYCSLLFAVASFEYVSAQNGPLEKVKKEQLLQNTSYVVSTQRQNYYHYRIIHAPEETFGYEILHHSKIIIRQTSIPCLSGNRGFSSQKDAEIVASLVIQKLLKGEMPPSVSSEELIAIHI